MTAPRDLATILGDVLRRGRCQEVAVEYSCGHSAGADVTIPAYLKEHHNARSTARALRVGCRRGAPASLVPPVDETGTFRVEVPSGPCPTCSQGSRTALRCGSTLMNLASAREDLDNPIPVGIAARQFVAWAPSKQRPGDPQAEDVPSVVQLTTIRESAVTWLEFFTSPYSPGPALLAGCAWVVGCFVYSAYAAPELAMVEPDVFYEQVQEQIATIPLPKSSPYYNRYRRYYLQQYQQHVALYRELEAGWQAGKVGAYFHHETLMRGLGFGAWFFVIALIFCEYRYGTITAWMESVEEWWLDWRERPRAPPKDPLADGAAQESFLQEVFGASGRKLSKISGAAAQPQKSSGVTADSPGKLPADRRRQEKKHGQGQRAKPAVGAASGKGAAATGAPLSLQSTGKAAAQIRGKAADEAEVAQADKELPASPGSAAPEARSRFTFSGLVSRWLTEPVRPREASEVAAAEATEVVEPAPEVSTAVVSATEVSQDKAKSFEETGVAGDSGDEVPTGSTHSLCVKTDVPSDEDFKQATASSAGSAAAKTDLPSDDDSLKQEETTAEGLAETRDEVSELVEIQLMAPWRPSGGRRAARRQAGGLRSPQAQQLTETSREQQTVEAPRERGRQQQLPRRASWADVPFEELSCDAGDSPAAPEAPEPKAAATPAVQGEATNAQEPVRLPAHPELLSTTELISLLQAPSVQQQLLRCGAPVREQLIRWFTDLKQPRRARRSKPPQCDGSVDGRAKPRAQAQAAESYSSAPPRQRQKEGAAASVHAEPADEPSSDWIDALEVPPEERVPALDTDDEFEGGRSGRTLRAEAPVFVPDTDGVAPRLASSTLDAALLAGGLGQMRGDTVMMPCMMPLPDGFGPGFALPAEACGLADVCPEGHILVVGQPIPLPAVSQAMQQAMPQSSIDGLQSMQGMLLPLQGLQTMAQTHGEKQAGLQRSTSQLSGGEAPNAEANIIENTEEVELLGAKLKAEAAETKGISRAGRRPARA